MATSEYIEYCDDDVKMEIKSEIQDEELFHNRKYAEYFEEDVKEEIVDKKNSHSKVVTSTCNICSKSFKSNRNLSQHIQSVHKGLKYPCNLCEYKATKKGYLKTHIESVHEKLN